MSVVTQLKAQISGYETQRSIRQSILPFEVPEIDAALPRGGLAVGSFHEVAGGGNGAMHCASATLFVAGIMARTQGQILWCIKQKDLFAPSLAQAGLDMDRIIFIEARDEKTLIACCEEGLRHGGVTGVVAEVSKLSVLASRRLQLAAEKSGALGIALWRGHTENKIEAWEQNTVARTRWRVTSLPSKPLPVPGIDKTRWKLELVRCQGGEPISFNVEACDETGHIALSADMAHRPDEKPTRQRRPFEWGAIRSYWA
jgi:protein ImuA